MTFTVSGDGAKKLKESKALQEEALKLCEACPPVECCPICQSELNGILGTFNWGIVNGEGQCTKCGLALRYYHRIGHGGNQVTLQFFYPLVQPQALLDRLAAAWKANRETFTVVAQKLIQVVEEAQP